MGQSAPLSDAVLRRLVPELQRHPTTVILLAYADGLGEVLRRIFHVHGAAVMGARQKMIATLLGHADTHATERYTHVQVDATRAIEPGSARRSVDLHSLGLPTRAQSSAPGFDQWSGRCRHRRLRPRDPSLARRPRKAAHARSGGVVAAAAGTT